MDRKAAIYMAHINPLTVSHVKIIEKLLNEKYLVYIFPVRFINQGREINTKSFPFSYEIRKSMIEAIFENQVKILPEYTFSSPFIKYLPPIISPYSWKIRNDIVKKIPESDFISYTGDTIERYVLRIYRLKPIKTKRMEISASKVKEMIYNEILLSDNKINNNIYDYNIKKEKSSKWHQFVPNIVREIIYSNWSTLESFAKEKDHTIKIMGMKFPKKGLAWT